MSKRKPLHTNENRYTPAKIAMHKRNSLRHTSASLGSEVLAICLVYPDRRAVELAVVVAIVTLCRSSWPSRHAQFEIVVSAQSDCLTCVRACMLTVIAIHALAQEGNIQTSQRHAFSFWKSCAPEISDQHESNRLADIIVAIHPAAQENELMNE